MSHKFRIGDKVGIKDANSKPTLWNGEIVGTAMVGSYMGHPGSERFEPHMEYIVRLTFPIIITESKTVVEMGAPSAHPGSLFIFEIVKDGDSLIALEN